MIDLGCNHMRGVKSASQRGDDITGVYEPTHRGDNHTFRVIVQRGDRIITKKCKGGVG